ncbi:hypothetical protein KIN20_009114 [Parelaphostrongylus tenuis]|uniref:Uncharacterized protein n=1 Tax=Parelaphostrongylus tenuis TaxID=148309 RepID=A0AAD5M5U4_PARTN|nr:hypothetical protein KIN20_009114 [Parelaphostrongylus tenuis]
MIETKPESITHWFEGIPQDQAAHAAAGYVLGFKSEDDVDWAEYNGVIKHRCGSTDYRVMMKQLVEPFPTCFFRLKVVGKNDKRGAPGPETKAMTSCGRLEEPSSNVRLEGEDFHTLKKVILTTQFMTGELLVNVEPISPRGAMVTWDLPDKDQD